jgi:hypothetical protein
MYFIPRHGALARVTNLNLPVTTKSAGEARYIHAVTKVTPGVTNHDFWNDACGVVRQDNRRALKSHHNLILTPK